LLPTTGTVLYRDDIVEWFEESFVLNKWLITL
jgi:hypothetical protein